MIPDFKLKRLTILAFHSLEKADLKQLSIPYSTPSAISIPVYIQDWIE
jgi:hypothetical protein